MEVKRHELNLPKELLEIIRPLRILQAEEAEFLSRSGFLINSGRITTAVIEEVQRRASAAIGRGDAEAMMLQKELVTYVDYTGSWTY